MRSRGGRAPFNEARLACVNSEGLLRSPELCMCVRDSLATSRGRPALIRAPIHWNFIMFSKIKGEEGRQALDTLSFGR